MERTERMADGCLEYAGSVSTKGYGHVAPDPGGSNLAHRIVWEYCNGRLSPGMMVLHHCDNPPCVEITHLWEGTAAQNSADMVQKGRSPDVRNERSGKAKLKNEQVEAIRDACGRGASQRAVAAAFGIHPAHVSRIVNFKRRPQE